MLFAFDAGDAIDVFRDGVERRVNGVGGEVEEEGLLLVAIDEFEGFVGEGVGKVAVFGDRRAVAVDGGVAFGGDFALVAIAGGDLVVRGAGGDEDVAAGEEAVELVEAAVERMVAFAGAQVPFADGHAAVAGGFEVVGDDARVGREAEVDLGFAFDGAGVELMAKAVLVLPREQRGAGGAADGAGDVGIGETGAGFGERIDVGGGDVGGAVAADVAVAHVVGEQDDQILFGGLGGEGHRAREEDAAGEH